MEMLDLTLTLGKIMIITLTLIAILAIILVVAIINVINKGRTKNEDKVSKKNKRINKKRIKMKICKVVGICNNKGCYKRATNDIHIPIIKFKGGLCDLHMDRLKEQDIFNFIKQEE